jgi:hypothetical protein
MACLDCEEELTTPVTAVTVLGVAKASDTHIFYPLLLLH